MTLSPCHTLQNVIQTQKAESCQLNPFCTVAISKLLEMIGRSTYVLACSIDDRSPLGHKPDCRLGWSSEYVRKSMHAYHSVSVACRPAEMRWQRDEIGSVHRSILVCRIRHTGPGRVNKLSSHPFLQGVLHLTQPRPHPKTQTWMAAV